MCKKTQRDLTLTEFGSQLKCGHMILYILLTKLLLISIFFFIVQTPHCVAMGDQMANSK